jgi:hypothetical protein
MPDKSGRTGVKLHFIKISSLLCTHLNFVPAQ